MTDWNHSTATLPKSAYPSSFLPVRAANPLAPGDPAQDNFLQLPVAALAAADLSNVNWAAVSPQTWAALFAAAQAAGFNVLIT